VKKQRISIVGTGYVGLSTAVAFASKGHKVITSTHDPKKAAQINKGIPPFYEPQLQEKLEETVKNKLLKCTLNLEEAVLNTNVTFIATGTPSKPDRTINLQYVEKSANEIGKALKKKENYHLIVVKSTVTPSTTEKTVKPAIENKSGKRCGVDFGLCMNPEFLRQGSALHDSLNPDRIVIGEHDKKSGDILEALYQEFYREKTPPIVRTNLVTAEFIKYSCNAFLATKISFINAMANICEKTLGVDVATVAKAMGLDKRIGPHFLNAGLGYGGSCLPKDVKALIAYSKELGYTPELLEAVENVNQTQPYKAVQLCKKFLGNLKNKKIAVLGLAFKPNTDDMREARSIPIINQLLKEGAKIAAYDPAAMDNAKSIFQNKVEYASSAIECLKEADCCILVTEWEEFKKLGLKDFTRNMRQPILIDGRRIYNSEEFSKKIKFAAVGVGWST
jgi:UDPglucose 6-dehydrogenase